MNGSATGRESLDERILVYNIGLAIHDLAFASRIYQTIDKQTLQDIDFQQPNEKIWV